MSLILYPFALLIVVLVMSFLGFVCLLFIASAVAMAFGPMPEDGQGTSESGL